MPEIVWEYGSIAEHFEEIRELGEQSWAENNMTQNWDLEYNLNDDFFELCEQNGLMKVLCGRDPNTRELVGMYIAILTPYLLSQRYTMSSEVVWYIRRDYMSKENVLGFLRAAEAANAEWGADFIGITIQDTGNVDRARETFANEGYVLTNLFFMREIQGATWHQE